MVAFIILHYKNLEDTLECIASIKKLDNSSSHKIIVVDNGSLIEKDTDILKKENIDLIIEKENLGFAKGNNKGCQYAIEKYKPDFLCVINSDIVIEQPNFINNIEKCYKNDKFDLLGPKIITNNSDSVNPFRVYKTLDSVESKIKYTEKLVKIYQSGLLTKLLNYYISVKRLFKKQVHLQNGIEKEYGVALHGCAIIFSKKYYEKYDNVFYPNTFLYHEEEFLYYRTKKDNLKSVYDPSIELFHKEGRSVEKEHGKSQRKKNLFRSIEILRSLKELKKVMQEDKSI